MSLALEQAKACGRWGDVPVGAVVVRRGQVVAAAGNQRERVQDPTAHAEILALREASAELRTWRLEACAMFVTLEPCAMCAGAIVLSRLGRLVFATPDPKAGFAGSLANLVQDPRLNHRVELLGGVLSREAGDVLRRFFAGRRG